MHSFIHDRNQVTNFKLQASKTKKKEAKICTPPNYEHALSNQPSRDALGHAQLYRGKDAIRHPGIHPPPRRRQVAGQKAGSS